VKVYLDEDLAPVIAEILRQQGVDAVSSHEVRNLQLDDEAQLAYATTEGRAIVTANVADFPEISVKAVAANRQHSGIVLVPASFLGNEYQAIADGIYDVISQYPEGLDGAVVYILHRTRDVCS
jgi:hypothetical protein